jgi:2-phosphosulfolactate phosphatase
VFDVLRATSTIVTALAQGAAAVIPAREIPEALAWRARLPGVLLAGEREGLRIRAALAGGIDFNFGNSPREFTPERVAGKAIVTTTTNGTRALHACAGAQTVLMGSFLNLAATVRHLKQLAPENVLLVCSGTGEQAATEDALAAGALADLIWDDVRGKVADSAQLAREFYLRFHADLPAAMAHSANAQRLLALSELRADVPFCLRRDVFDLVAAMDSTGNIRKI